MKQDRCPVCHRKQARTHQQNALLWLLYHRLSEKLRPGGKQYSAESYHEYYKSKFLGCREVKLPNGRLRQIPYSTTDLDTAEFSDYFDKVQADAAERNVWLEDVTA